jgi:YbbR domain-containing protein
VVLSGPESLVGQVKDVRVTLDLNQAHENINRTIPLQAVDANENPVEGVTVNPEQVVVFIPITQRGGYRDVVVKAVLNGQIANGYRLTNISVFPPTVTVFSTNPNLVEQLPGSVETTPLNLNGAKSDLDIHLGLNLPTGVIVVGDQTVEVLVGVAPIEGSLNLSRIKVDISNLSPGLVGKVSPETVDIIISGPLPMLDALTSESVKVFVDLSGQGPGTYQLVPRVDLAVPDIKLESILPGSIEVTISTEPTPSPTPRQGINP